MRGLNLIEEQQVHKGQNRLHSIRIKGRRCIRDTQAELTTHFRSLSLHVGFILDQQNVPCIRRTQRLTNLIFTQNSVCTGIKDDLVFPRRVDRNDCVTGGGVDLRNPTRIDTVFSQPVHTPLSLRPDRTDMASMRPGARGGNRHIRTFATQPLFKGRGCQRFTRLRHMRQGVNHIDIDRTEVPDSHKQPPFMVQPMLQAARTAMFSTSLAVDVVEQIWIGLSTPDRIGPTTVAPPISCISLTEIEAE